MSLSEVEIRSQSDSGGTTEVLVNSVSFESREESRSHSLCFSTESKTSAQTTDILNPLGIITRDF
jgi:hypothetical protein